MSALAGHGTPVPVPVAAAPFPCRALWAAPGGCAVVGLVEALVQRSRFGGGPIDVAGAALAAASAGAWLGVLSLLVAVLARRRAAAWTDALLRRLGAGVRALAPALVLSAVLVGVGWWVVAAMHELFRARQLDFVEDSLDVWRVAVVIGVPVAVLSSAWLLRAVQRRLGEGRAQVIAGRVALWVLLLAALAHACSGPFVAFFGPALPLCLAAVAVFAVALVVPARLSGRRATAGSLVAFVLVTAAGTAAWHRPSTRALLRHDARVYPVVHELAVAFLDRDGDGELAAALGGVDCDDGDPRVATWRPEMAGNGIDDNCRAGDASEPEQPATAPGPADRPLPIVLVTLDTVRADHLELHGWGRATMPRLTAWSTRARVFARAYSPSNHTGFSVPALLAGQGPERLVREPEILDAGGKKFTAWLPRELAVAGYETLAVNPPLLEGSLSADELRFERLEVGPFDHAAKNRGSHARQVADWVTWFLRARRDPRPLFLWIHLDDPHAAHAAHEHFAGDTTADAYDNELYWVDVHLARILAAVEGVFGSEVIVAITSDHGEELGEQGAHGHGHSLRETAVHVPLLVAAPGLSPGLVQDPVGVGGLAPALLELVGRPTPPRMTAPSILADPSGPVLLGNPFFWNEQRMDVALIDGDWKLSCHRRAGTCLLFDLAADPGERRSLVAERPDELARLRETLDALLEQAP